MPVQSSPLRSFHRPLHSSHLCQDFVLLLETRCWCNRLLELGLSQYESCQCNRVRPTTPHTACGNGPPWRSNDRARKKRESNGEQRKRQCVCHNNLLLMTKQRWKAASAAPDTRVSLCMRMRVPEFAYICASKCLRSKSDIKVQSLSLIVLHSVLW